MATFAETMLAKYETLLQTSAGLDTVSVDGQSVRYTDVEAKYRYWKREVGRPSPKPAKRAKEPMLRPAPPSPGLRPPSPSRERETRGRPAP